MSGTAYGIPRAIFGTAIRVQQFHVPPSCDATRWVHGPPVSRARRPICEASIGSVA